MSKEIVYLKKGLSKNEEILGVAEIHWSCYIVPSLILLFSIIIFLGGGKDSFIPGLLFLFWSVLSFLSRYKTEYVVTNKRVISKTGIITVKTREIKNSQVESVSLDQGVLGTILGYADISFSGTGTTKVSFQDIKDPVFIKSKLEEIIEGNKK
ncbi:MAG: PH domain-containing protein [Alphaproteobacteria bacterium]